MATRSIYLNIEILSAVRVTLSDGSTTGTHLLIDEKDVPALETSGLADFIEGSVEDVLVQEIDEKGKLTEKVEKQAKAVPSKWLTKEGNPIHEFLGLPVQTTKVEAVQRLPNGLKELI